MAIFEDSNEDVQLNAPQSKGASKATRPIEESVMTLDELNDMPRTIWSGTSKEFEEQDFLDWIYTRKQAGLLLDIEGAELKGWECCEDDPYGLRSFSIGNDLPSHDEVEKKVYYFARDRQSGGWIWQGDLSPKKSAAMTTRIDEHQIKMKEFYENRRAAGLLIDINTCESYSELADYFDPYGVGLVSYDFTSTCTFVSNKGSDDWVEVEDLPSEKQQELSRRNEQEEIARQFIVGYLFAALLRRVGMTSVVDEITKLERKHGARLVEEAIRDHCRHYPYAGC
jgi:hypothetical protein